MPLSNKGGGVTTAVADADYVNVTGDNMTGQLTIAGSSLTVLGAAKFGYDSAWLSSATLAVRSTSTTSLHPIFEIRQQNGTSLVRATQDGFFQVGRIASNPEAAAFARLHVKNGDLWVEDTASSPLILLGDNSSTNAVFQWDSTLDQLQIKNNNGTAMVDVQSGLMAGSGATKSTFSTTGDLSMASDADITLTGPTGFITTGSSITAGKFIGDGSSLTGVGETNAYASSKTFQAALRVEGQTNMTASLTVSSVSIAGASAALNVAGSTLTVANSGIITAPSQPGMKVTTLSNTVFPTGVLHNLYWSSTSGAGAFVNNGTWVVTSSQNFVANGAGTYRCTGRIVIPAGTDITSSILRIGNDSVDYAEEVYDPPATTSVSTVDTGYISLANAVTARMKFQHNASGNVTLSSNSDYQQYFSCMKIW